MRLDRLTSKFQVAISDAQSLALGRDHQFIEPIHLMLALLIAIGISGLMMSFVTHADVTQVKAFFGGMLTFGFFGEAGLPAEPIVLVHLLLVALLMIIFPISKLMHAPGIFFSPTRNQVDNPREKRHVSGWALELERQGKNYLDELKK